MQILKDTGHRIIKALCRWKIPTVLFIAFCLTTGMKAVPQNSISREYQIKAVFLYNFSQFVEWPEKAFTHADAPLIIGVLGENPFANYLEETVKGEKVNGHPLEVKHFQTIGQVSECHILFIHMNEKDEVKKVLAVLGERNILTVSELANFAKQGGIVRFFTEDNRTRIRINLDAAKKAELTISSKLLKVADVVNSQKN
jgi:hypothetical protein